MFYCYFSLVLRKGLEAGAYLGECESVAVPGSNMERQNFLLTPRWDERRLANKILNALGAHIAVVDLAGTIVAVNEAWSRFARQNGDPDAQAVGVGSDYLGVCRRAAEAGDFSAEQALHGILAVMDYRQPRFELEYPCHSPDRRRWFRMSVTALENGVGVVVSHEDITARHEAEGAVRRAHDELEQRVSQRTAQLEKLNADLREEIARRQGVELELRQAAAVFENANEAVVITDDQFRIVAVNHAFTHISGFESDQVVGEELMQYKSTRHHADVYRMISRAVEETGQWQGEVWNRRKNGDAFPAWESISVVRNEQGHARNYVVIFSDISVIKNTEARLHELAHHDPLTGLANRLLFSLQLDKAIERARRHQRRLALLFLDLDRFKIVNDTLGHAVGDRLLKRVAARLKTLVRGEDIIARLGGDEFVVIADELAHSQDAALLAKKLLGAFTEPVQIGDDEVVTGVSIGISIYPDDATNAEDLIKSADAAMYHAKDCGRGNFQFYHAELTSRAVEYFSLQNELRWAIERDEFLLYYQPQVSLTDGRVEALEALIRWNHTQRGLLPPEVFIPIAEETGLIQPIGEWVIRSALSQIERWRLLDVPPVRIAVNVSGRELLHGNIAERLRDVAGACGIGGTELRLDIEVTENLQRAGDRIIALFGELRGLGVGICIDDFGTGYSSLHLLRHLPVDTLKIDKFFVSDTSDDADSRSVVEAILALGRSLRLKVIAEGVETQAQLEFLRSRGCDLAQGYFFSEPVPAAKVPELCCHSFPIKTP